MYLAIIIKTCAENSWRKVWFNIKKYTGNFGQDLFFNSEAVPLIHCVRPFLFFFLSSLCGWTFVNLYRVNILWKLDRTSWIFCISSCFVERLDRFERKNPLLFFYFDFISLARTKLSNAWNFWNTDLVIRTCGENLVFLYCSTHLNPAKGGLNILKVSNLYIVWLAHGTFIKW